MTDVAKIAFALARMNKYVTEKKSFPLVFVTLFLHIGA